MKTQGVFLMADRMTRFRSNQKNLIVLFWCGLLISLLVIPASGHLTTAPRFMSDSWLERESGFSIVYLHGSPYEMGYQQGTLLKTACLENLRAFTQFASDRGFTRNDSVHLWEQVKGFIPEEYLVEMQGLADATNLTLEDVGIGNVLPMWVFCSGFIAWGPATRNGSLLHARSLDFYLTIRDPVSGNYVQDNAVLFVRDPDDGYASLDPSIAGLVGSTGGFNEHGVSVDVLVSPTYDEGVGEPMAFHLRDILDHATTAQEAFTILSANRTRGWNFLVSQESPEGGYVVEQSKNHSYIGTWNSTEEANRPFWQMDHVVRRTNLFIGRETAATQRKLYNPRVLPILGAITGLSRMGTSHATSFIPWYHYKVLSKAMQRQWGNLTLNSSMTALRSVYNGKTDPVFFVFQKLRFYTSLIQWVGEPSTGDLAVSFASGTHDAFTQPVSFVNLYTLLAHTK